MSKADARKRSMTRFKRWVLTAFPTSLLIGGALGIKYDNLLIGLSIGAAMGVACTIALLVAVGVWTSFGETPNG
tara:strand:+ start:483 stop:704 length:222 start_codon:yes stop_codon:yes gene_type:complete